MFCSGKYKDMASLQIPALLNKDIYNAYIKCLQTTIEITSVIQHPFTEERKLFHLLYIDFGLVDPKVVTSQDAGANRRAWGLRDHSVNLEDSLFHSSFEKYARYVCERTLQIL